MCFDGFHCDSHDMNAWIYIYFWKDLLYAKVRVYSYGFVCLFTVHMCVHIFTNLGWVWTCKDKPVTAQISLNMQQQRHDFSVFNEAIIMCTSLVLWEENKGDIDCESFSGGYRWFESISSCFYRWVAESNMTLNSYRWERLFKCHSWLH